MSILRSHARISSSSADGAFAAIDDEQDQVGFFGRRARLPRGGAGQAFFAAGDAAGVDEDERALGIEAAHAVVAVARDAGLVVDQGVARARQRIEQRRLTDVGATDQGDEGSMRSGSVVASGGVQHAARGSSRPALPDCPRVGTPYCPSGTR